MKITDEQLRSIVDEYQKCLPGWQHVATERLLRATGPFVQAIAFQRLSGGDYRPMNCVSVLVAPAPTLRRRPDFLVQMPHGRPRTVSLQSHGKSWQQMLETMRREFIPVITESLDDKAVFELCEKDAIPKSNQAYALAAANAYYGRVDRALYWASMFPELVNASGIPWESFQYEQKAFLDTLQGWLLRNDARRHLETVLAQEKTKWGVA